MPFTINKLAAELTWGNTDLTYTGTEQSVSATVTNAVSGDTFNIIYEGNTQTEAGDSYTATVTGLGNDNYTLTGATGISKNGASAICKLKIRQSLPVKKVMAIGL